MEKSWTCFAFWKTLCLCLGKLAQTNWFPAGAAVGSVCLYLFACSAINPYWSKEKMEVSASLLHLFPPVSRCSFLLPCRLFLTLDNTLTAHYCLSHALLITDVMATSKYLRMKLQPLSEFVISLEHGKVWLVKTVFVQLSPQSLMAPIAAEEEARLRATGHTKT